MITIIEYELHNSNNDVSSFLLKSVDYFFFKYQSPGFNIWLWIASFLFLRLGLELQPKGSCTPPLNCSFHYIFHGSGLLGTALCCTVKWNLLLLVSFYLFIYFLGELRGTSFKRKQYIYLTCGAVWFTSSAP